MSRRKILIIDDDKFNLVAAKNVLKDTYELYEALSAQDAFDVMQTVLPDLILLDIVMPEMDGYEMLTILKKTRRLKKIPVIFITSEKDPSYEVNGFNLGAADFITKPFVPAVMKKRISVQIDLYQHENNLEKLVEEKYEENLKLQRMLATGFAELVESRDGVTGGHIKNTSIYYEAFVKHLRRVECYKDYITDEFVRDSMQAAPLHDIGKIGIDDAVLRKPSSLGKKEMNYMQTHSELGGATFHKIRKIFPENEFLQIAENMARFHHERWDGHGYPSGLLGEEIPLEARIMSVVDVYDALTSRRPYKEPFEHRKAMEIIKEGRGTQFDPTLVDEFMKIDEIIKDRLEHKEELRKNFIA